MDGLTEIEANLVKLSKWIDEPSAEQDKLKMCQHIDAHRAFIQRDLTAAARSAGRYQEGTRAYNRAVEAIRKLQGELAKHKEVVRISGPKCGFCLERD